MCSRQMETEKNKHLFVKIFLEILNKLSCYTSSIFFIQTLKMIGGAQIDSTGHRTILTKRASLASFKLQGLRYAMHRGHFNILAEIVNN